MSEAMSLPEMIAAERLPATESAPQFAEQATDRPPRLIVESEHEPRLSLQTERLTDVEGASLWGVEVLSSDGPALPGVLGKTQEQVPRRAPDPSGAGGSEPYRPPWLEGEFFPRIAPLALEDRQVGSSALISEQLSRTWPWSTMGKVWFGRGTDFTRRVAGSGVLVGRDLMMTVSHGVPWGASPWWIEFVPGYASGAEPFGRSYVRAYRGVRNDGDVTGLDYVICRLYNPLGDRAGWMGSQWWSDEDKYYGSSWTSVGYPGSFLRGERPAVQFQIGVRDIDDDGDGLEIETVRFADFGWSGGPLWGFIDGEPRVIGIESGFETDVFDPTRTVFAGGQHMVDLIRSPP